MKKEDTIDKENNIYDRTRGNRPVIIIIIIIIMSKKKKAQKKLQKNTVKTYKKYKKLKSDFSRRHRNVITTGGDILMI